MGIIFYIMGVLVLVDMAKPDPTAKFILNNCKVVKGMQPGLHIRCRMETIGDNRTQSETRRKQRETKRNRPRIRPRRPLHKYQI